MAITIRELIDGRDLPVSIEPDKTARAALDVMLKQDFTQLPVVDANQKPIGLITSDSILRAIDSFKVPLDTLRVRSAMESAKTCDPDDDVAELLNGLRDRYAVLVVDGAGKLVGILTGYDTAEYFRSRAEDMMLLEDIETSLRDYVLAGFTNADGTSDEQGLATAISGVADATADQKRKFKGALKAYFSILGKDTLVDDPIADKAFDSKFASQPSVKGFDGLTLKQYVDLLRHPICWSKVQSLFSVEQDALVNLFDGVRNVRNALAHFREITPSDRARLRVCAHWLERCARPGVVLARRPEPAELAPAFVNAGENKVVPVDESVSPNESKYARLALTLQRTANSLSMLELTFKQLEAIIDDTLPRSAREHRSWWANDSTSRSQSKEWLEVGWRVSNVNILDETVTFERIRERERAYIEFFSQTLALLRAKAPFRLKQYSPLGLSWQIFAALPELGRQRAVLVESFARGQRFRVELYIDTGQQDTTKLIFDRLSAHRDEVERAFGEPLSWERMDDRRASRVACYRPGTITMSTAELSSLRVWGADRLVALRAIFEPALVEALGVQE